MPQAQTTCEELAYNVVAKEVERSFGEGSVGLGESGNDGGATDDARATFVRACILLVVNRRCDQAGLDRVERASERLRITREVRLELAALLGADENEVFRLHHRAAELRARDPAYREAAQAIERRLEKRYGMEA